MEWRPGNTQTQALPPTRLVQGLAAPVGRQHAGTPEHEGGLGRQHHVDTASQRSIGAAAVQGFAGCIMATAVAAAAGGAWHLYALHFVRACEQQELINSPELVATREEEHAVSTATAGPFKP